MFLGNFFKQIRYANLEWLSTQLQRRLNCRTNVVGVHVAVVQPVATHHHDRVANLAPRLHKRFRLRVLNVQQEHHLVTQLAHVHHAIVCRTLHHALQLLRRWPRNIFRLGQRLAVHHMQRRVHQQQEPRTTRIDNARIFQHRQLLGRVGKRRAPGCPRNMQHCSQRCTIVRRALRRIGRLAHHRQNRSFNRLQHRLVCSNTCRLQRVCQLGCCRRRVRAHRCCKPPQNLAQDHATISARPHQRPVAYCLTRCLQPTVRPLQLGHHRIQRAGHVGARVAIGHWVHVQTVDALLVGAHGVAKGDHRFT